MRIETVVLVAAVLGLVACDNGSTEPARPSLTGEWSFTFRATGQDGSGQGLVVPHVYLKDDVNGVVSGYMNGYTLMGRRSGNTLELTAVTQKGAFPVAASYLELHAVAADSVAGTGETPMPGDSAGAVASMISGAVTGTRVAELSVAAIDAKLADPTSPIGLGGSWSSYCDLVSGALAFVVGDLTGNTIRPMGGCAFSRDGGGNYLFGRDAPGSSTPVWTQNVYVPNEMVWTKPWEDPCPSRRYDFNFSYKGPTILRVANDILGYSKDARGSYYDGLSKFLNPGEAVNGLADKLNAFGAKYGDYAFILVTHERTKWVGLYVITQMNGVDPTGEAIVKTVATAFGAEVRTGRKISDHFDLKRNVVPGACGDYVGFAYLVGTADVDLD